MDTAPSKTNMVIEALAKDIRSGMFQPGEKLPSMRTLGERFRVSTMVMHQASCRLEEMGLLKRSSRSGLFIPENTRQSELLGFITGVIMGSMENYYEAFLSESSNAGKVVMTSRPDPDAMESMLEKKPLKVYVDVGSKEFSLPEIRRATDGLDVMFCNRFEWTGEKPESAVLSDWISITEDTLRHFLERGHKKVVFISHDDEIREFKRIEMTRAAERVGLKFDSPEFQWCSCSDFQNNPERVLRIFKHDPPTAAFARGDQPLFSFTRQLELFLPECRGMEKIGAFDSVWSHQPGMEFTSWHWDWDEFWEKVFAHEKKGVEYYQPKLNINKERNVK